MLAGFFIGPYFFREILVIPLKIMRLMRLSFYKRAAKARPMDIQCPSAPANSKAVAGLAVLAIRCRPVEPIRAGVDIVD